MENKMKMPANYLAMNEEEMTYTEGGWFFVDNVMALVWGYRVGQYMKKNPDVSVEVAFDKGLEETKAHWGNTLVAVVCVANFVDTALGALVGRLA